MVNPDNTKINFDPSDERSSVSDEDDVRPVTSTQPTNKDFKKVLSKNRREGKEGLFLSEQKKTPSKVFSEVADNTDNLTDADAGHPTKDDEENASQGAAPSLFDLSKSPHTVTKEDAKQAPVAPHPVARHDAHTAAVESPSEMFKRMSTAKPAAKPFHETKLASADHAVASKKETINTRYSQEQSDLSYVNPMAVSAMTTPPPVAPITETAKVERPAPIGATMQELVDHLVKTMFTIQTTGKTETVVTLEYPPAFKDVNLIVTTYDSAKGQFNIAFENLTQAAQKILDFEENRRHLIASLEAKGYSVQQLQTTTSTFQAAPPTPPDDARSRQDDRDDQQDEQQQKRQRR